MKIRSHWDYESIKSINTILYYLIKLYLINIYLILYLNLKEIRRHSEVIDTNSITRQFRLIRVC